MIITTGEEEKSRTPNAKSIVTNALPLISRNSFSPTSCQRTTRHSKDYAESERHLVGTFLRPSFAVATAFLLTKDDFEDRRIVANTINNNIF